MNLDQNITNYVKLEIKSTDIKLPSYKNIENIYKITKIQLDIINSINPPLLINNKLFLEQTFSETSNSKLYSSSIGDKFKEILKKISKKQINNIDDIINEIENKLNYIKKNIDLIIVDYYISEKIKKNDLNKIVEEMNINSRDKLIEKIDEKLFTLIFDPYIKKYEKIIDKNLLKYIDVKECLKENYIEYGSLISYIKIFEKIYKIIEKRSFPNIQNKIFDYIIDKYGSPDLINEEKKNFKIFLNKNINSVNIKLTNLTKSYYTAKYLFIYTKLLYKFCLQKNKIYEIIKDFTDIDYFISLLNTEIINFKDFTYKDINIFKNSMSKEFVSNIKDFNPDCNDILENLKNLSQEIPFEIQNTIQKINKVIYLVKNFYSDNNEIGELYNNIVDYCNSDTTENFLQIKNYDCMEKYLLLNKTKIIQLLLKSMDKNNKKNKKSTIKKCIKENMKINPINSNQPINFTNFFNCINKIQNEIINKLTIKFFH